MPTAARLVAAICLGLLSWIVAQQVMARMTEISYFGQFPLVAIGLGLVVGWITLGGHTRPGPVAIINSGVTAVVVLAFWAVFVFGVYEMVRLSLNRRFHGLMDAIYGLIDVMIGYARVLAVPEILATLLVGGLIASALTRFADRTWR